MLTLAVLLIFVVLIVLGCSRPPAAQRGVAAGKSETTIAVSGAFALFPMMTVWTEEYQTLNSTVQFDVQAGGAGKGMTDVLSGAVDIAMLSREPRQAELDQGAVLVPVTIDAVVGVVNADNPVLDKLLQVGLTPAKGAGIWFTEEITTWGELVGTDESATINVYTRSDASGAAEMWARYLGGQAQEQLKGTAVHGDPGLAEAVRQDPQGIGYNNIGFAYDQATGEPIAGLRIVPLDLNGDGTVSADEDFYDKRDGLTAAIAGEVYPFPPARVLYLVTKEEPTPAIVEFYRWVLTEGQAFVPEAGYVPLPEKRLQDALAQLGQ